MADPGYYFLGDSDRIVCFYYSGGLKNFEMNESPWYEHAKGYPVCEYVLRNQGVECAKEVCLKFQKLKSLQLTHPSKSHAAKEIKGC